MSSHGLRRAFALASSLATLAAAASARADVTHPHTGVTLVRHSGQSAMAIIDLCADGVSIRATKYAERKGTPQQWGEAVGAQVAMNADFFDFPGWTYVVGRARGAGEEWPAGAQQKENRPYWEFGPGVVLGQGDANTAPAPGVTEIVGGHNVIISGGNTTGPWAAANDGALLNSAHARSAIGRSADGRTLYMMSTTSSISASTLVDMLQQSAAEAGAPHIDWATNQDGGGSSQLYVQNLGQVISTGRQVNNHLGVYATGNGAPTMCNDHPPHGFLDSAGCEVIKGWAQDEDAPTSPLQVTLGFGGEPGQPGIPTETGNADISRDDLCTPLGSCNHGYELLPPLSLFDGAEHPVFAFGLDANGNRHGKLAQSPLPMKCSAPDLQGVIRHIINPDSYAAWGFVSFVDQLAVTDEALAALMMSLDLVPAPVLVRVESEPEVWLVDGPNGTLRRHVPNPTVAAHWHLDLGKVELRPKAEVDALVLGPPLRERPVLVKASGNGIFLLDDDLTIPYVPTTATSSGVGGQGPSGAGGSRGEGGGGGAGGAGSGESPDEPGCSCRAAGGTSSEGDLGAAMAAGLAGVAAVAAVSRAGRRRRR